MSYTDKQKNNGVTLLLAVLFLSAGLSIALGIFYIVYVQLQINRGARDSYLAFFAADAGKECVLYYLQKVGNPKDGGFWSPEKPCLDDPTIPPGYSGNCNSEIECVGVQNIPVEITARPDYISSSFEFDITNASMSICAKVNVTTVSKSEFDPFGEESHYTKINFESSGKSSCSGTFSVNRTISGCLGRRNDCDP